MLYRVEGIYLFTAPGTNCAEPTDENVRWHEKRNDREWAKVNDDTNKMAERQWQQRHQ